MTTPTSKSRDISLLVFFPALFLLVIVGTICFRSSADWEQSVRWTDHTVNVLSQIREVWSLMRGAESDTRAYLMTGAGRFPATIDRQIEQAGQGLEKLRELIADNGIQLASLHQIERNFRQRVNIHREARAWRLRAPLTDLQATSVVNSVADYSEKIRGEITAMERRELLLLNYRSEASKVAARRTKLLIVFGGVLAAWLLVFARRMTASRLREKRELNAALTKAMAARDTFLATVSHELRTPLHSIVGSAASLREPLSPLERAQCVEILDRSSLSLLALIDDILELAKMDAGRIELLPAPFSLQDLVEGCLLIASHRARQKGIRLDCRFELSGGQFVGDAKRIGQILTNLLVNAVKFTLQGGVTLTVREENQNILFEVRDTGIGIAAAKMTRLFEKFDQLDSQISRDYGGTGLGLTIAKQLANSMGGDIEAASREGQGSVFTVRLPLPRAEPGRGLASAEKCNQGGQFPLKILIADDVDDNRVLLQFYLKHLRAELAFARDGEEALAAAIAERYDMILLDIRLPRRNGFEVITALRAYERENGLPATPIVTISAQDTSGAPGAENVFSLAKPAAKDAILGVIFQHARPLSAIATGQEPLPEAIVYLKQTMRPLIPPFLNNRGLDLAELQMCLQKNDRKRLYDLCHSIGGVTSSFGFAHASELTRELWDAASRGNREEAEGALAGLKRYLGMVKVVYI